MAFFKVLGLREKILGGIADLGDKNPLIGNKDSCIASVVKKFKNMDRSDVTAYNGVQVENLKFLEFVYLLLLLFDIDIVKTQAYFGV